VVLHKKARTVQTNFFAVILVEWMKGELYFSFNEKGNLDPAHR
jgi:hypothetical protein